MATYGPKPVSAPPGAIIIHPGDNVSAIVNGAPAGATFYFEAGTYRGVSLTPKDGQTFIGAEGAVLNGSEVLSGFTQQGSVWVVGGQTQEGLRIATGEGDGVSMRPGYPETVFIDDVPLKPVDALSKLVPGTFYFDYAADKIYLADNPAGHKVEAGKLDRAFEGGADGVTVQNFVIEKYNTPTQYAAIQGNEGWTIKDNEVRLNYGVGIDAMSDSHIVGNYVHDNGEMGIGGGGDNLLVEGNEIARNGWWSGIDVFWEGGGTKFTETDGLIVRNNYSHDNHGFGLWTDIDNINTLYEGNIVVDNSGGGITHEISYTAIIRNNVLMGNGYDSQGDGWLWGGQIQIQNSQDVDIYGNRIDMTGADGGNGIGLIQQNRGTGAFGPYTTTGNSIHDNIIVSRDGNGIIGGVADFNEAGLLNGGNTWSNNHYFLPAGDHFWWGDTDGFSDFRLATGETGTLSQSFPDTSTWTNAINVPVAPPQVPVTPPPIVDPIDDVTNSPPVALPPQQQPPQDVVTSPPVTQPPQQQPPQDVVTSPPITQPPQQQPPPQDVVTSPPVTQPPLSSGSESSQSDGSGIPVTSPPVTTPPDDVVTAPLPPQEGSPTPWWLVGARVPGSQVSIPDAPVPGQGAPGQLPDTGPGTALPGHIPVTSPPVPSPVDSITASRWFTNMRPDDAGSGPSALGTNALGANAVDAGSGQLDGLRITHTLERLVDASSLWHSFESRLSGLSDHSEHGRAGLAEIVEFDLMPGRSSGQAQLPLPELWHTGFDIGHDDGHSGAPTPHDHDRIFG